MHLTSRLLECPLKMYSTKLQGINVAFHNLQKSQDYHTTGCVLQVFVCLLLLYHQLGVSAIVSAAIILILCPLQILIARALDSVQAQVTVRLLCHHLSSCV